MSEVEITSLGIKKALKSFSPVESVTEYIWNGFDAGATTIDINAEFTELGAITKIEIIDNGDGIIYEDLSKNFKRFLESQKNIKRQNDEMTIKGTNGYGRLTFFTFAQTATWDSIYFKDGVCYNYQIKVIQDKLNNFEPTVPVKLTTLKTGTKVTFNGIFATVNKGFVDTILIKHLKSEFAWFLELNKEHDFSINVNGVKLKYSDIISDSDDFQHIITDFTGKTEYNFKCKFLQWNQKLNDEYSRFYFLNDKNKLKSHKTTRLNKKGDNFNHSLIVQNDFFDLVNTEIHEDVNGQYKLFAEPANYKIFNKLIDDLNDYLKKKRRPFLHIQANTLIKTYEKEKVMPVFGNDPWDNIKKEGFECLVRELYEVEPSLFVKLNTEQKKTFLHLLYLLLDSSERDNLFEILSGIIEIDSKDRAELAKLLQTTKFDRIIAALKLIRDRILIINSLKQLVFNKELQANEVNHLQSFVENHYWIFGEQYRLVCSAEEKFETALRKFVYLLRGVDEKQTINHPDKYKEMDIFLVGQDYRDNKISNIVLELKNPSTIKKLTQHELSQVTKYMNTIISVDEFNASNYSWDFYLIGQDYNDEIENAIENAKNHGELNLAFKAKNFKIYVKKWSEVVNEVELRLKFINEKLQFERNKLAKEYNNVSELLEDSKNNSAVSPSKLNLPPTPKRKRKAVNH